MQKCAENSEFRHFDESSCRRIFPENRGAGPPEKRKAPENQPVLQLSGRGKERIHQKTIENTVNKQRGRLCKMTGCIAARQPAAAMQKSSVQQQPDGAEGIERCAYLVYLIGVRQKLFGQGVVLLHKVLLHIKDGIFRGSVADHHGADAGVDDHAAAHIAGACVMYQLAGGVVQHGQIEGAAQHLLPGSGDDAVLLRMDAAAKLIALAPGDAQLLPAAGAKVAAVGPSAGRARSEERR